MPAAWPTRPGGPAAARRRALSGANEVAVEAFLDGRIPWTAIAEVVDEVLEPAPGTFDDVADVLDADRVRA